MQLDHVDLGAGPPCCSVDTALHLLWLQVRGDVAGREEHRLQPAHAGQRRICDVETQRYFPASSQTDV